MPVYIGGCIVAGLLFGAMTTALDGDWGSPGGFLRSALVRGIVWAVPFGLLTFVLERRGRRRAGLTPGLSSPRVHRRVLLPGSTDFAQAFERALETARNLSKAKIIGDDRAAGVIKARTGPTWQSWGEVVEIQLRQVADAGVEIDVRSKPVLPLTFVDYGKNERNVRQILERLGAE